MLRTVNDQPTLWDAILPSELLVLPAELGRVDALLDDPVFFAPFAAHFDARIGRPSIPMETYLRLMFLKFRYRLGYEALCREVADSISWQRFCRIPFGIRVPHPTTLMKITTRCGDDAVAGLNEALLAKAAAAKLLRTDKVRADTTVVAAACGLSDRFGSVGQGGRHDAPHGGADQSGRRRDPDPGAGSAPLGGSTGPLDRLQAAAARCAAARSGPGRGAPDHRGTGRDRRSRHAGGRRGAAQRPPRAAPARAGSAKAGCSGRSTTSTPWSQRTQRVVAQARSRLAGVMPESATRLVSLHDADARPIRKGRLGKPVEFGYKAQVVDNADGVILDHTVEIGNPADAPQLAPAIATDHPPHRAATAGGHRRPRLRRCNGRTRPTRPRGAQRGDPPQEQTRLRAPRVRTPSSLPRQGQMANRIRRTNQPPQTKLRLEPHRTDRHHRRPNLVRTRRLRPQPRQDQRPRSMKPTPDHPTAPDHTSHPRHRADQGFFRSK